MKRQTFRRLRPGRVDIFISFLPAQNIPAHGRVLWKINYLQSQRNCNLKIPCVCTTTFIIMKMIYCVNMALARNQIRKHFSLLVAPW